VPAFPLRRQALADGPIGERALDDGARAGSGLGDTRSEDSRKLPAPLLVPLLIAPACLIRASKWATDWATQDPKTAANEMAFGIAKTALTSENADQPQAPANRRR
jgi:hypothetical protein